MNDALLRLVLLAIAAITVLSGVTQMAAGGFVLSIIATDARPPVVHMFMTIGMFMVITGAMFLQSLWRRSEEPAIPLWIAVQKLAAAVLVTMGWMKGIFAPLALGVAAFDALTGLLALIFWRRLGP
ncbi:hypothetical protein [Rhizobium sp. Leaf453]|uniref:hypothetical protein n=1 Tax=Rhizobium sp. Leaf453 TaxID=1736380 RepID=UPI000713B13C|nr:hypothetical protein [Rhizobium sp. Leaf453]KQU08050.1 hypothetical protein ASG68_23625 [Rhizobium sp. Leaf453]